MEKDNTKNTVSFEWHSLLRDLIRNSWAILLAGLIVWMGVYIAERSIYKPEYTSHATLVVRSRIGTSEHMLSSTAAAEMAEIYTHVFQQPAMKRLAAENLGLSEFTGKIKATTPSGINIMDLSVTGSSPEEAYRFLASVLKVYPNISDVVFTDSVIDILTFPQVPVAPSNSISSSRRAEFSLLAMAAQALAICLLSVFRATVKNEKDFVSKVDGQLLGTVVHEPIHMTTAEYIQGKKRAPLINDSYASLRFPDDYQRLANKLEYMQKHGDSRVFSVTSVAENEGKSTVAINLALALASRGWKIALLDLDVRKPAIYKILGGNYPIESEITDVLTGKLSAREFKLYRYRKSGLLVGFSKTSHSNTINLFSGQPLKNLISAIRKQMDFVILDSSPIAISADAMSLSALADKTILVVRTDAVAAEDVNDAIVTVSNVGGSLAGCVLNDVYEPFTLFGQMGSRESGYYGYKYGYHHTYGRYENKLSEELLDMGDSPADRQNVTQK